MSTRDNYSNQGFKKGLVNAVRTADVNGPSVDTLGFDSAAIEANVGASGDTLSGTVKIELEVEESDDDSTWSDVADADLLHHVAGTNTGCFAVIDDPAEDDAIYSTGYRGAKRYIRVVVNLTGTHTNGTPISATVVLGHAHLTPVNTVD